MHALNLDARSRWGTFLARDSGEQRVWTAFMLSLHYLHYPPTCHSNRPSVR
jgi:hypothetical protein